jgi:asparagine N-glycosylation enzyme membrane subunit Stt3
MKKGLLIILLTLTQQLVAQKASPALSKSYSKTELQAIEQDGQGTINVLNYAVDHACYTVVVPEGKEVSKFPTISLKSKKDIRFTDYQLHIIDRTQYFKIEGSNELLVVKSINVLKLEMQNKK